MLGEVQDLLQGIDTGRDARRGERVREEQLACSHAPWRGRFVTVNRGFDFEAVKRGLARQGFAVAQGNFNSLDFAVAMHNLEWTQSGSSQAQTLRPMRAGDAPRRSLSAIVGHGQQPFHTDGAHLATPPDIVVLHSEEVTPTATLLLGPLPEFPFLNAEQAEALRNGIFTVRGNDGAFLASALQGRRLRYDPGCMTPSDNLARAVGDYFTDFEEALIVRHEWNTPNTLLLIDNRRMLHARAEVAGDAETRVLGRRAYMEGSPS